MPLSEYERQVLLFNLHVEIVPEESVLELDMAHAMKMLLDIYNAGEAYMRIGEHLSEDDEQAEEGAEPAPGENVILIRSMSIDSNGIASVLLHHGDARAADPALIQIRSGDIRSAGKKPGEGLAHAAHMLISTKKHLSNSGQSHALLERVPNLGRSTVIAFINRLLRQRAKRDHMEFKDPKTKRGRRCHPRLAAHQQLSHRLKTDLEAGKLSHIEFVTRNVVAGFEEKNVVVPVSQTISHKIVNAPTGQRAFDLLERAKAFARGHNFEEMQIRFRKVDTDQNVSPRFATDLADAKDAVYSRFEVIRDFRRPLEQCPKQMVKELHTKLLGLFEDQGLWK